MSMKMVCACLMILFLTSAPMGGLVSAIAQDQAQDNDHQPPIADEIVSMMQSKLNLTQDQVTAVTPIIEKYSSKRGEFKQSMEDGTADRGSMRNQMKQLREDEAQELGQVLSADQINQWKSMMHKRGNSNGGGNNAPTQQ